MKEGDIVVRKSYNKDIIFKIIGFSKDKDNKKVAILKGVAFRLIADAYLDDLELVEQSDTRGILMDKNVQNNQDKITFRDKLNKKIKEIIGLINRFIQDVISKLYSKHEPLKKHINQVGESKIIEKLKGRRVRMPKIDNCDTVYELMTNRFDNCIKSQILKF